MSFDHSETFEKLPKALVALQAALPNPKRDGRNPHFRSKFLTLDELVLAVKPVLAEHGFSVTQTFDGDFDAGKVFVVTTLVHESGEWISSTLPMPTSKQNDPQAVGSSITYARRYALAAILGVVSYEDDDGNSAAERPKPAARAKITPEQEKKIWELAEKVTGSPVGAEVRIKEGLEKMRSNGITKLGDMPASLADQVIEKFRAEIESVEADNG